MTNSIKCSRTLKCNASVAMASGLYFRAKGSDGSKIVARGSVQS